MLPISRVGPGDLLELQLISRLQWFVPLEKMVLEGELYGTSLWIPVPSSECALTKLYPKSPGMFHPGHGNPKRFLVSLSLGSQ